MHDVHYVSTLFEEILIVDKKADIAPVEITNNKAKDLITNRSNIPTKFTKLAKWLSMRKGSGVFNKKDSNVYTRFRLKLTVSVEMVMHVCLEFLEIGRSHLYKKQNQAMETETPMMLLFVNNGSGPQSISSDLDQMLQMAYEIIEINSMMPEEFKH